MSGVPTGNEAATLAALAQPTRLRIIAVIAAGEIEGTPAGIIAREVACPASTLSFHLKELAQAGLLQARPRGRFILYALNPARFATLADFVARLPGPPAAPAAAPIERDKAKPKGTKKAAAKPGKRSRTGAPDGATTDAQLSIFSE
ncbi:MAG: ArsR family transcriptional regulator [Lysobacterales bacterium]|nr:MAG: ArsR family transcriptional regulator [Xanthomonadales bacterium]